MTTPNEKIETIVSHFRSIALTTQAVLDDWRTEGNGGNLPIPKLLGRIAVKLNWDENQILDNDPLVRNVVRNHPDWLVSLGTRGGVQHREDKERIAREKAELKAQKKGRRKKTSVSPELVNQVREEMESRLAGSTETDSEEN